MKVTDSDTIQIMKDYMANGRFSRGVTQVHADASLAFVGNLNQPVETLVAQHRDRSLPAPARRIRPRRHRPPSLLHAGLGDPQELARTS